MENKTKDIRQFPTTIWMKIKDAVRIRKKTLFQSLAPATNSQSP